MYLNNRILKDRALYLSFFISILIHATILKAVSFMFANENIKILNILPINNEPIEISIFNEQPKEIDKSINQKIEIKEQKPQNREVESINKIEPKKREIKKIETPKKDIKKVVTKDEQNIKTTYKKIDLVSDTKELNTNSINNSVKSVEAENIKNNSSESEVTTSKVALAKSNPSNNSDENNISIYLTKVKNRISQNLQYPNMAKKMGIEGDGEFLFVILKDGTIKNGQVAIKKSTSKSMLDKSAIQTIQNSSPFDLPPIDEIEVIAPISFKLDEG